jgi:hypothetical protein
LSLRIAVTGVRLRKSTKCRTKDLNGSGNTVWVMPGTVRLYRKVRHAAIPALANGRLKLQADQKSRSVECQLEKKNIAPGIKTIVHVADEALSLDDCHGPQAGNLSRNPRLGDGLHNHVNVFVGLRGLFCQTGQRARANPDSPLFEILA